VRSRADPGANAAPVESVEELRCGERRSGYRGGALAWSGECLDATPEPPGVLGSTIAPTFQQPIVFELRKLDPAPGPGVAESLANPKLDRAASSNRAAHSQFRGQGIPAHGVSDRRHGFAEAHRRQYDRAH
jgi:hypothetical protein